MNFKLIEMKTSFPISTVVLCTFYVQGQSSQDKEAVNKIVIEFQDDFNEGSFS